MKRIALALLYLVLFVLFVVAFAPKNYLYFKAEHLWQKDGVVVSGEQVEDGFFSLTLKNGEVFIKDIPSAIFEDVRLYPEIFFNLLSIKNAKTSSSLPLPKPIEIVDLKLVYTPFYPIKVWIRGKSNIGDLSGWIDLKAKKGRIDIASQEPLEKLFGKSLIKVTKGKYRYEFGY